MKNCVHSHNKPICIAVVEIYIKMYFIPQFLKQLLMMKKNHQECNLRMMITKVTTLLMLKLLLVVPMTLLVIGPIYK